MELGNASKKIDGLAIGAIRSLAIDMTNKAKSGHPGMALDAAPTVYTLFKNHLVSDPKNPEWINRDRFVLSAGHASALLYAMGKVTNKEACRLAISPFNTLLNTSRVHGQKTSIPNLRLFSLTKRGNQ